MPPEIRLLERMAPDASADDEPDALLAGDAAAFGRAYDRHGPEVHRFLRGLRLGLDAQEQEDALQETFLRLYRQLRDGPGWDTSRPLRPYLLGIARHVALDLARRPRPGPLEREPRGDERDAALAGERAALVQRALGALPPDARAALLLRHVHGLRTPELAEALACSLPTARARAEDAARLFAVELRRLGLDRKELAS